MRNAFHRTLPLCSVTRSVGLVASAGRNRRSAGFMALAFSQSASRLESAGGNSFCHRQPPFSGVNASYRVGSSTAS